jgi:hypothetical protein
MSLMMKTFTLVALHVGAASVLGADLRVEAEVDRLFEQAGPQVVRVAPRARVNVNVILARLTESPMTRGSLDEETLRRVTRDDGAGEGRPARRRGGTRGGARLRRPRAT